MTVDDLETYLNINLNACIAARSTTETPLAALTPDQIYTRNYRLPAKKCTIFLDPQPETVQPMTMNQFLYRLPVDVVIFQQGDTETMMRAKGKAYASAVLDCIGRHPDFMAIEYRESFDGVEGKEDIKAVKITAIFEYEEAI